MKEKKKVSGFNILVLFMIALAVFGLICFVNFAYQASVSEEEHQDSSQVYYVENTE